jgi:hypothetical protein
MSSIVLTSLDNQSSSLQPRFFATYRETLLEHIKPDYERAYEYYIGDRADRYDYKQLRFLQCHNRAIFARNTTTGVVRVLAKSCHLKFCPICNKSREKLIRKKVTDWLSLKFYPKFMTLTLKHNDDDLHDQINKLYHCFKEFRRIKLLKKKVNSGIWFFQITKDAKTGQWHPHIHCILTGSYIPQRELSREWLRITGDSSVVDIRLVKNVESAACEVARYAACAVNIRHFSTDELAILEQGIKNRRLFGTWGKCRKLKLLSPLKYDRKEWQTLGSWNAVVGSMETNEVAKAIYDAWKNRTPLLGDFCIEYMDDFVKGLDPPEDVSIE